MRISRSLAFAGTALTLVLGLSACGGGSEPPPPQPAPQASPAPQMADDYWMDPKAPGASVQR